MTCAASWRTHIDQTLTAPQGQAQLVMIDRYAGILYDCIETIWRRRRSRATGQKNAKVYSPNLRHSSSEGRLRVGSVDWDGMRRGCGQNEVKDNRHYELVESGTKYLAQKQIWQHIPAAIVSKAVVLTVALRLIGRHALSIETGEKHVCGISP